MVVRRERMTAGEGGIRKGRGAGRNTAGKGGTTVTAVMRGRRPKGKAEAGATGAGAGAGVGVGAERGSGRAPLIHVEGKSRNGSVNKIK